MARNVLGSWGSQAVQIVSGFVVPRLIDHGLGQEALGIWDFAWSVVVYFSLLQMGVTGSISRAVAFHRAQENYKALNEAVSSVAMVMRVMGGIVFLLTVVCSWGVGHFFAQRFGAHIVEARWLVFMLGCGMVMEVSSTIFSSILTGCHEWQWHNRIYAATNVLKVIGMISALLLGAGLIGLAAVHLATEILSRSARIVVAYRTCPWLEIRLGHFRKKTAREMISFSGKSFVSYVSQLLINSSVSIIVAAHFGPAALALYSRPMALVRTLNTFVNKYAMVAALTITSLQGAGQDDEVRALTLKSTRFGLFISLPVTIFLALYGGEVLHVWMGKRYVNPLLIGVLIVGYFHQISYIPLFKALIGLDLHGKPAVANVLGAAVSILGAYLTASFHGSLEMLALAVVVPLTIVNGVYLPIHTCRALNIPASEFWREVWRLPVLCVLPFLVCLLFGKFYFQSVTTAIAVGAGLGFTALGICYWNTVLPSRWKRRLMFARG